MVKRICIFLITISLCLSCLNCVVFSEGSGNAFGKEFFVATYGKDSNDGSIEAPFATIEKARDTIRAMETLPQGGVAVNIRGGNYPVSKTIEFKAEDSGTKECPIVYRSYNNEKVTFSGGKSLDTSKIHKVTDESLLNGLVDEDAREYLYSIDLKEQGVTMHKLEPFGRGYTNYFPNQIYMNNTQLIEARWPNKDESQSLVICQPLTDGVDTTKFNGANLPVKLVYPDSENRSSKWNIKSGDAYVGGAVVFFWAQVNLRLDNIDATNKVATSIDASTYSLIPGAEWGQQYKVYFSNIFAEIDRPGEYYVDREAGVMYFYPVGDVEDAEIVVSDSAVTNILADDLKFVTFKGIDFKYGRGISVYLRTSDNVRVEDCEFNGGTVGLKMNSCTNTVVSGNVFHNLNSDGIDIGTGDRANLTPSGNVIENNLFYNLSVLRSGKYAIYLNGTVGDIIRNNEFNDLDMSAILLQNCNDTLIEYNKFKNCLLEGTDYGAVYWGRQVDSLGHVIRYNYFESIGSEQISKVLGGGDARSIFVDDGATGADVYGNVFFDGGVGATMFSTNGGEFHNIHNNVFIADDTDRVTYDVQLNSWGSGEYTYKNNYIFTKTINENIPARVWLYHMDMRAPVVEQYGTNSGNFTEEIKALMWSEKWAQHYQGTWWQKALEFYSKTYHDGAKAYYDAGDKDGLVKYLDNNLPAQVTNTINNNILLGRPAFYDGMKASVSGNYMGTDGSISDSEKAMFVDYNDKNFKLTDDGLSKVKAQAPDFQQIPFEKIGLLTNVGGNRPTTEISDSVISGFAFAGNRINADYDFIDPDGDMESATKIYWYVSDKQDGSYTRVQGEEGSLFKIPSGYAGKYVKYEIVPYDTNGLRGDSVWSSPIFVETPGVADVYEFNEAILKAEKLLKSVALGGEYSQSDIDDLQAALNIAKAAILNKNITQSQVEQEILALNTAIRIFTEIGNEQFYKYYDVLLKTDDSENSDGAKTAENDLFGSSGGYLKEGNRTYWLYYNQTPNVNSGYNPFGVSKISDTFTGEYVITNKIRLGGYPAASSSRTQLHFVYDSERPAFSFLGFVIDYTYPGKAEVSFTYNCTNPKNQKFYPVGSFQFTDGAWYTYQQIYNLDKKTAELLILDSAGNEVASLSHELLDEVDGITVQYKDFCTTNYYLTLSSGRAKIAIDDCEIGKVTAKPVTANFDSEMVLVTYEGKTVKSGVPTFVPYNSDAVFSVSAKNEYKVEKITVDGVDTESKTQVTFAGVNDAHTFSVTAKYNDYDECLYSEDYSSYWESAVTENEATHLKTGYVTSDGNVFRYVWAPSGTNYDVPFSYVTLSDGLTGEYILSTRLRYHNWLYTTSPADVHLSTGFDISDKNKAFFGYKIAWDAAGTATVSFNYRYKDSVETGFEVGKFAYVDNAWYTYQQIYNLDNKKVYLHVYDDRTDEEVATFAHELKDEINGTAIPYKHLTTSSVRTTAKTKAQVFIDDIAVCKTTAKSVFVNYDNSKGCVTYNGEAVVSGRKNRVPYNSTTPTVFCIEAKEGYEIADVKVNSESMGNLIDSYEFKNLTADQELEVVFAEKKVEAPTVEVTEYATAKNYAYKIGDVDATSPYTIIVYCKIAGQPETYGFALSNGEASVKLDAKSISENGTFAIRVVGGAILPGSYTAVPYWTDGEGEAFAITVAE